MATLNNAGYHNAVEWCNANKIEDVIGLYPLTDGRFRIVFRTTEKRLNACSHGNDPETCELCSREAELERREARLVETRRKLDEVTRELQKYRRDMVAVILAAGGEVHVGPNHYNTGNLVHETQQSMGNTVFTTTFGG